jgi:hypothetical protein
MIQKVKISQVLKRVTSEELEKAISEVEVRITLDKDIPPRRPKWSLLGLRALVVEIISSALVKIGWSRISPE